MSGFEDFDHNALSAERDPFPLLSEMRQRCPVAHSGQHGGFWVLTRYADVRDVAVDHERFTSGQGVTIPGSGHMPLLPIELDPPMHKQIRGPLAHRFGASQIADQEPQVREIVTGLIDSFIERGSADLAAELTIPLPAIMITRILGLPESDADRFIDWATRIMSIASVTEDVSLMIEIGGYFGDLYHDRTALPREDIPSLLAGLVLAGRPMSAVEFISVMATLFSAGQDTTANAAANALEYLALNPPLRQRLVGDLSLIDASIDELLRFISPVPALARSAAEDVMVGGQLLRAHDRVLLHWMAANHDPERFPDPDEVVLGRPAVGHLGFGFGIHRCLGQHVARLELRVLLEEVLTRLPDYRLSSDSGAQRRGGVTRVVSALPVEFEPAARLRTHPAPQPTAPGPG